MNLPRIKTLLAGLELKAASLCFLLLFATLCVRVGAGLLIDLLLLVQQYRFFAFARSINTSAITAWIGGNVQWTGEAAQWLWVWLVALGIAEAERNQSNLKVDFLHQKLKPPLQSVLSAILDFLYLGMVIFLFIQSFEELQRSRNSLPTTLPWPNLFLYLSFTAGLFFLALRLLLRIFSRIILRTR